MKIKCIDTNIQVLLSVNGTLENGIFENLNYRKQLTKKVGILNFPHSINN